MKKVLFAICCLVLTFAGFSAFAQDLSQPIMGTLPSGVTMDEAEDVLTNICVSKGWNVVNHSKGKLKIAHFKKGYDFHAIITYDNKHYKIAMDKDDASNSDWNAARRYKLFNKNALKLSQAIQKYGANEKEEKKKHKMYKERAAAKASAKAPVINISNTNNADTNTTDK